MRYSEILRDWDVCAALWLMADPDFLTTNEESLKEAIEVASPPEHAIFLKDMACCSKFDLKIEVAKNRRITAEIADVLAADESPIIRAYAAEFCSSEVLLKLAVDAEASVRNKAARFVPLDVLKKMDVSEGAKRNSMALQKIIEEISLASPEKLHEIAMQDWPLLSKYIALNTNANAETLRLILKQDMRCAREVAKHRNCPSDVLDALSEHQDYRVRISVARNCNSGFNTVYKLCADTVHYVRRSAHYVLYGRQDIGGGMKKPDFKFELYYHSVKINKAACAAKERSYERVIN